MKRRLEVTQQFKKHQVRSALIWGIEEKKSNTKKILQIHLKSFCPQLF